MPKGKGAQVQIKQIGEMLDDGLILVQPDGAIIAANAPAVRHFGEDLVGKSIFDVIKHPDISSGFEFGNQEKRGIPPVSTCYASPSRRDLV